MSQRRVLYFFMNEEFGQGGLKWGKRRQLRFKVAVTYRNVTLNWYAMFIYQYIEGLMETMRWGPTDK